MTFILPIKPQKLKGLLYYSDIDSLSFELESRQKIEIIR